MNQDQTEKGEHRGESKNDEVKTQTIEHETLTEKGWRLSVNEGHNRAGFVCGISC